MQDTIQPFNIAQPLSYQIEVQGRIEDRWKEWFEGLEISPVETKGLIARTKLTGTLADQAALIGVLRKIYDRGYILVCVKCLDLVQTD